MPSISEGCPRINWPCGCAIFTGTGPKHLRLGKALELPQVFNSNWFDGWGIVHQLLDSQLILWFLLILISPLIVVYAVGERIPVISISGLSWVFAARKICWIFFLINNLGKNFLLIRMFVAECPDASTGWYIEGIFFFPSFHRLPARIAHRGLGHRPLSLILSRYHSYSCCLIGDCISHVRMSSSYR